MDHRQISAARIVIASMAVFGTAAAQPPLFRILEEEVPGGSFVVAVGDFDGDADNDILTMAGTLLNDGHALFSPHPGNPLSPGIFFYGRPEVGDINGDAFADAITPLSAYINDGTGALVPAPLTFPPLPAAPPGAICANVGSRCLALGDVDGDSDLDLVVTTSYSCPNHNQVPGPVLLWLNDGTGVFTQVNQLPPISIIASDAALVDVDVDLDLDLVLLSSWPAIPGTPARMLLLNNGAGTFAPAPGPIGTGAPGRAFAAGDFNGDGLPDLVFSTSAFGAGTDEIVLGTATGFGPPLVTPRPSISDAVMTLDVDADGRDEVVRDASGSVTIHAVGAGGVAAAPLQGLPPGWSTVHAWRRSPDFDGDGDRDLLVVRGHATRVLLNTGSDLMLEPPHALPLDMSTWSGLAGDTDADGDADLVLLAGAGTGAPVAPRAALNDGFGRFAANRTFTGPPVVAPYTALWDAFDAEGDGDLDLWVAAGIYSVLPGGTTDQYLRNSGTGWVAAASVTGTGDTRSVAHGDLDGDGDQDLVLGRMAAQSTTAPAVPSLVVFNLGGGGWSSPVAFGGNHTCSDLALADVDGDGDLDVLQANIGLGPLLVDPSQLYVNDGSGGLNAAPAAFPVPVQAGTIAAGDLDGDGDVDVINGTQVNLNSGNGTFVAAGALTPGLVWDLTLADADGDGDLDAVDGAGFWFRNNGIGIFSAPEPFGWGAFGVGRIAVADFDRDNDLDILSATMGLVSNTSRHLARGNLARLGRPATLDIHGPPGGGWQLFLAAGTASFALPPFGTVFLDLATAVPVASGTLSAAGSATFAAFVPPAPSTVGLSLYWQAIVSNPVRLTNLSVTTIVNP